MRNKIKLLVLAMNPEEGFYKKPTPPQAVRSEILDFIISVKRHDVKIVLIGSRNWLSGELAGHCDEFIATENVLKSRYVNVCSNMGIHKYNCITISSLKEAVEHSVSAGITAISLGLDGNYGQEDNVASLAEIDVEALITIGKTKYIDANEWAITETEINPMKTSHWESIFGLSNGFIGVRGCHEEDEDELKAFTHRGTFINGFFEYDGEKYIDDVIGKINCSTIFPVCDWTRIQLFIDDEKFGLFSGKIIGYKKELDMQHGVLTRTIKWESPSGKRVNIENTRFVCPRRKHSALTRYSVEPVNFSGAITLRSEVKARLCKEGFYFTHCIDKGEKVGRQYLHYRTNNSLQELAMAFSHCISSNGENAAARTYLENDTVVWDIQVNARKNEKVTLDKFACFYTSVETQKEKLTELALSELEGIEKQGFERLLSENKEFWLDYWAMGDIEIGGNTRDQQSARFSLFHLRQAHPEDGIRSISATGNTGDNYRGHVFWDTEMFMVPHFNYMNPELVKQLLMYRYNIIGISREQTRKMGNPGVRYAWNTIDGVENGGIVYAAINQYHINCDIVYAIWRYYISTQDDEFLHDFGAEMVFEISRYLFSIGAFAPDKGGRFCINLVCGPDEYHAFVNNNCYTNGMVRFQFEFACRIYNEMERKCPGKLAEISSRIGMTKEDSLFWEKAAEKMYIPYNEELGIHLQDDSYMSLIPVNMGKIPLNYDIYADNHWFNLWRKQVSKQADVLLLMFTLGNQSSTEQKKANYDFYEPRTNHGSSLSPCIHSIIASELGLLKEAYEFLQQTLYLDLYDLKSNARKGLHYAALGGSWMAIVNGLAGMRDYEDELIFNPKIPEQWEYYKFKLVYRGRLIEVNIDKEKTSFKLLKGEPVHLKLNGKVTEVNKK